MENKIKSHIDFLYNGFSIFYPQIFYEGKEKDLHAPQKRWKGWTHQQFADYAITVTHPYTDSYDLSVALEKIKEWKEKVDEGKALSDMPPQDVLEKASEIQEGIEEAPNDYKREQLKKEALLVAQQEAEKGAADLPEEKEVPVEDKRTPAEPEEKAPAVTTEEKPSAAEGKKPPTLPSPPTKPEASPSLALQVVKNVDLNPVGKVALSFAQLPFYFAGPSLAADSPQDHVTASAQNIVFLQGITSKTFKSSIKPRAMSLGVSENQIDKLIAEIAKQEKAFPGMFRRIQNSVEIQSIVVRTGIPQATAAQLFLTPSPEAGGYVVPKDSLLGNLLGRVGQQIFGGAAKKVIKSTLSKVSSKVGAVVGEAGGPVGAVIGYVVGWVAGKIAEKAYPLIKKGAKYLIGVPLVVGGALVGGLAGVAMMGVGGAITIGASGFRAAASSIGSATSFFISNLLVPSVAGPFITTLIALPLVIGLILFIINSGAYLVPPSPQTASALESRYIGVEKEIVEMIDSNGQAINYNQSDGVSNDSLPITVSYRVTVTAKEGTLTNITFENICRITKEGSPPPCTPPTPEETPSLISPVENFAFEYSQEYGTGFQDSFVTDVFSVNADAPDVPGERAAASVVVKIGDPPDECPASWPVDSGYITQGAYTTSSHSNQESIDIGGNLRPVLAGHSGSVTKVQNNDSCLGDYIEIQSTCEGRVFVSQYAHLEGVEAGVRPGTEVAMGQQIALSGNTGSCTEGPHLHYRFKYSPSGNPKFPDNPPFMMSPYIPQDVPRGCIGQGSCGVSF